LGAFVLPAASCANGQVQNFDGLRHYTSGKPYVSSGFSYNSDPKLQQTNTIFATTYTHEKSPLIAK
jgi:hypothetical protein